MDTVSVQAQTHNLNGKWKLYYHLPQNNNWELSSYSVLMDNIDTIEKVISLNQGIHANLLKSCMMFVMKDGISPMWEDKQNREGGCFSYKVINKNIAEVWKSLFYLLCGESLCDKKEQNDKVNGITISPKKNFCIIKIWFSISSFQDPKIIKDIQFLSREGCLFKKHVPEF
jgi:translation initiation factor 4E|tara:strand:+ start:1081 stop:1593 length:513 start_codon:yes stop_codon:yes gene_type:complete